MRINDKFLNCVTSKNNIFKCDIKLINNKEGVREEARGTERRGEILDEKKRKVDMRFPFFSESLP